MQILSTPLAFHYHSTDIQSQLTAARYMAALRKGIRSLGQYYKGLSHAKDALRNTTPCDTLFPHCTSFKSLEDTSIQTFCYKEQHRTNATLVFFGELLLRDHVPICIKFVQQYSTAAHKHCASMGFAPRLRGFERLPGGWYMVVMDRLIGYELLADVPKTAPLPSSVFDSIGNVLKTLHGAAMVHGDIRDTNIMTKKDDRTKFMIIDFDWAGTLGDVCYPPYVNYIEMWRPEDARDGMPIKAAHDHSMLHAIIDKYNDMHA